MSTQISAFVIDDHPLVARGIADFLQSHCGVDHAQAVSGAAEFWQYSNIENPPALVVLDFWLPDGASLPLLTELKIKYPLTPILVMTADDDYAVQNKVLAAGAHGFINKQEATEMFVQAVKALLSRKTWFKRPTHTQQSKELVVSATELGLTGRQGEILAKMMKGYPNKQIAQELSVSEQTVKEHVSGILERLGVHNRIEAITKLRGKRIELQ